MLYEVCASRCPQASDISVLEVHNLLDSLQHAVISGGDDAKKQAMCNLALRLTANENMWLSRIILKEMKIGANEKTILAAVSPHAFEFFSKVADLRCRWRIRRRVRS